MISSDITRRGATAVVYGAIVGAFVAHLAFEHMTVTVALMYGAALMMVALAPRAWEHGIVGMWIPHRVPASQESGRLNLPADYFMPYSVCPKCKVEALHWIKEEADLDWATKALGDLKKRYEDWAKRTEELRAHAGRYSRVQDRFFEEAIREAHPRPVETAEETLAHAIAQGSVDVVRECRECSHTWGQKVGSLLEVA